MVLNFFVRTGTTCHPHSKDNNNLVISCLSQVIRPVNVDPDIDKANGHKTVAFDGHFTMNEHISRTPGNKTEQTPLSGQK